MFCNIELGVLLKSLLLRQTTAFLANVDQGTITKGEGSVQY
jgi:hypothetical protein